MASVTSYVTKDGKKLWKFSIYAGKDNTGKRKKIGRQGFRTKQEARLTARRLEEEVSRHGFGETSQLTFREVYESWFEQYKNTVKESTWVKTRDNFRIHILPRLGDKLLIKITPIDCQEAVNEWFNAKYAKYQTFLNMVSRIYRYAIRMDLVINDPTKKVIVPKDKNKPQSTMKDNFWELDELTQFFKAATTFGHSKAFAFFRLAAFTGMRKGELLALQWSDIDFDAGTVTVNKTQTRGDNNRLMVNSPKTFNSNRIVNVDPKTLTIMRKWQWSQRQEFFASNVKPSGAEQLCFTNEYNEYLQPTYPTKWLNWIIDQNNKQKNEPKLKSITVHGFRHTYASLAFESGLSIKQVQEQLGHRNFQTTMDIYTAVTKKQSAETATKFAAYVNV